MSINLEDLSLVAELPKIVARIRQQDEVIEYLSKTVHAEISRANEMRIKYEALEHLFLKSRSRSRSPPVQKRRSRSRSRSPPHPPQRRVIRSRVDEGLARPVYVGNIRKEHTKEWLHTEFSEHGPVKRIYINDRCTHAVVTFENPSDAEDCIANTKGFFDKHGLKINYYEKR